MPFHSTLSSLQRLRASLEKMARLRLQVLHGKRTVLHARRTEIKTAMRSARESILSVLQQGTISSELQIHSTAGLKAEEQRLTHLLAGLETDIRRAEQQFMQCRREREIVENAIASAKAIYDQEVARREQARVDGEVLQRQTRERNQDAAHD